MASIGIGGRSTKDGGVAAARMAAWGQTMIRVAAGLAIILLAVAGGLALLSYSPDDPSFNHATTRAATNLAGLPGAWFADLTLQLFGFAGALIVPAVAVAGMHVAVARKAGRGRRRLLATTGAMLLAACAAGVIASQPIGLLTAGAGGAFGYLAHAGLQSALVAWLPHVDAVVAGLVLAALILPLALALAWWGLGLDRSDWQAVPALLYRSRGEADADEEAAATTPKVLRRAPPPAPAAEATEMPAARPRPAPTNRVIADRSALPPSKRAAAERQAALDLGDVFKLPALSLLKSPPKVVGTRVDTAALEQNARLLETVLDDFGVKGTIVEVRPGPVVTMYELEPAPGLKASRVIGLADDIARSMSAISARVAVVPGRNVIGIELPNARRETVALSELLSSPAFEGQSGALPLVLGKDIAGDPVVADLAPMPHLLIAGTTGSGKSVGLNAMIMSLLYRLTPEQCRLIMIDPKMLELSVYDGIPHLLAPVVTEPAKAIRALKWAVEQMEDRYRMMASINVRSLSGFNARVREAKAKGQPFIRRVQTGWDPDSGQPLYEEERLEFEPLPLVVVIVDELADLMMTAGKEVEFLIQRLAQKARAAGIHLIMATQRPSVDVITGVIKANLPTRISFSVTSKIDSRTILGEQGAEQLLGRGDMLYMPGGKQIVRVHGPFVSDEEVEAVADHWRAQGAPDYVQAVTEEPAIDPFADDLRPTDNMNFGGTAGDEEADLYRRAVQIVAESQKASTSYIQRQLRIGYNNAARLIERMEKQGLVGAPDHVGRREVLIDAEGNRV